MQKLSPPPRIDVCAKSIASSCVGKAFLGGERRRTKVTKYDAMLLWWMTLCCAVEPLFNMVTRILLTMVLEENNVRRGAQVLTTIPRFVKEYF